MLLRRHPGLLLVSILVASAAVATPAAGQGQPGDRGEITFTPTEWINDAPIDLQHVRGRPIALTFIRLSEDDSLYFLEVWDDLQDEFAADGVCFAAVTNEAPNYLKEQIEVEGIRSTFAIDPADAGAPSFKVQLFPSVVIIDSRGAITYHETPGSHDEIRDAINAAVQNAPPLGLAPAKQKSIKKLLDKDDAGKAYAAIVKVLKGKRLKDDERAELTALQSALEIQTSRMLRASERYVNEKDWVRGVAPLQRIAKYFGGIPGAEDAESRLKELSADETTKDEIAAARAFADGERLQRTGDKKKAGKAFESLARLYPETQAGKRAKDLAEYLVK